MLRKRRSEHNKKDLTKSKSFLFKAQRKCELEQGWPHPLIINSWLIAHTPTSLHFSLKQDMACHLPLSLVVTRHCPPFKIAFRPSHSLRYSFKHWKFVFFHSLKKKIRTLISFSKPSSLHIRSKKTKYFKKIKNKKIVINHKMEK